MKQFAQTYPIFTIVVASMVVKLLYFLFSYFLHYNDDIATVWQYAFYPDDIDWYREITEKGYLTTDIKLYVAQNKPFWELGTNWAFFPLFPMLIWGTMQVTYLGFNAAAFSVSFVLSTGMFIAFYYFVLGLYNRQNKAIWAVLLLMLLPFHYYFSMALTESLYLLVTLLGFISIQRKKYYLLAFTLFLLPLTRSIGLFTAGFIFIFYLEQIGVVLRWKINLKKINLEVFLVSLIFILPIISFALFCCYAHYKTGDYFAFKTAQMGWNRHFCWPWQSFFASGEPVLQFQSVYAIVFLCLAIWSIKTYPASFVLLLVISLCLPLSTSTTLSISRFVSCMFPFTLLIAHALYQYKYKIAMLGMLLAMHLLSYYNLVAGHDIG